MSDFLFAGASWLSGAARTLDLAATFDDYNMSLNPAQADWLALNADALATYKDLWGEYAKAAKDIEASEVASAQK